MRIRKISEDLNKITIGLLDKVTGIDKMLAYATYYETVFYIVSKERGCEYALIVPPDLIMTRTKW